MKTGLALILIVGLFAMPAAAQDCRLYLANHSDGATSGFAISLDAIANSGICSLSSVRLGFAVGDGTSLHNISVPFAWQTGVVYTVSAEIGAAGPQQFFMNGQSVGSIQSSFQPAQAMFSASLLADSGVASEDYIVRQISVGVLNGPNELRIAPNGGSPIPLRLILLPGGPAPWNTSFAENTAQTTTVTATFRFDAAILNPHQFDPYIDTYGQAIAANWPSKIHSDGELQATVQQEQAWFAHNAPLQGFDPFGGSTDAGWTADATGYYHTARHDGHWYLISPMGNPLFYLGLTAIGSTATPITMRESIFQLPPDTGPLGAAYSTEKDGSTQDFSFAVANQIRKYGSSWQMIADTLFGERLASWGFLGGGKFGNFPEHMPHAPVLAHGGANVCNAVPASVLDTGDPGHPDIFNAHTVKALKDVLAAQIGSDKWNQYIIGWSVGNESEETVRESEVKAILNLDASSLSDCAPPAVLTNGSYAKRAFVDYALARIYGGSVSALAAQWNIQATTNEDVYAATNIKAPSCPGAEPLCDVQLLRLFYENAYWSALYHLVKSIDPNHLYFGTWTQPAFGAGDWPIAAVNSDVIGFDDFTPGPLEQDVQNLIKSTDKPVMLGAWGVPCDYAGTRGFGWNQDTKAMTLSDSASGNAYAVRLQSLAANPYVVGAMIFQYNDQPLTGNGSGPGTSLINGDNRAFGMVDVTDTPKFDLVNEVRAANIAALQSLGLLTK